MSFYRICDENNEAFILANHSFANHYESEEEFVAYIQYLSKENDVVDYESAIEWQFSDHSFYRFDSVEEYQEWAKEVGASKQYDSNEHARWNRKFWA